MQPELRAGRTRDGGGGSPLPPGPPFLEIGTYIGSSGPNAGTLTVKPDGKSGELDADLSGSEHVKGSFACSEVIKA